MGRKRKFDSTRIIRSGINKSYRALDRALAPRRPSRRRSMFDHLMDKGTFAPRRRR